MRYKFHFDFRLLFGYFSHLGSDDSGLMFFFFFFSGLMFLICFTGSHDFFLKWRE